MPEAVHNFPHLQDLSCIYSIRTGKQEWATCTSADAVAAWLSDPPALAVGQEIEVYTYAFKSVRWYSASTVSRGMARNLWQLHGTASDA